MNEKRIAQLLEMEKHQPNDAFLKFALAQEYVNVNNYPKATEYFELLVEKFPNYVPTYYQFGKLYERVNEITKCIYIYKVGIEKAKAAGDLKTATELTEALTLIEDE